ncbi:MAG: DUF429 domain-containing protein [Desulfatibacillaceae bacterium]
MEHEHGNREVLHVNGISGRTVAGVDGCRAGWFGVILGPGERRCVVLAPAAENLLRAVGECSLVLVDVPMGLPETPGDRECDRIARKMLGGRGSSVFPVPCREAVYAGSFAEACKVNRRNMGRAMSIQSYHILPKVRDMDGLLRSSARARGLFRESHPELCFKALAGGPLRHAKKTRQGVEERLGVLERFLPMARAVHEEALSQYLRKDVARDDVVDAMCLAVVADRYRHAPASAPKEPPVDACGLRMEIVHQG